MKGTGGERQPSFQKKFFETELRDKKYRGQNEEEKRVLCVYAVT
jgi:hypothetical protein